jgi:hypothetical protein
MSTAQQVINSAARALGIKRLGIDLSAEELADNTDLLREMLAEWQAGGIKFKYNLPLLPTDELEEWDWSTSHIKLQYSLRLAINYSVDPTAILIDQADRACRNALDRITCLENIQKPSIMPIGSGNQDISWDQRQFYINRDRNAIADNSGVTFEDAEGGDIVKHASNNSPILGGNP